MKTAIVTDSNCGITQKEASELGIYLIPMPVIIRNQTYYEGQDLDSETFFRYLTDNEKIMTSQPSPAALLQTWEQILGNGYDNLVYIPMSSGLSSSYQTACILAEEYPGQVYVADTHRISVTQRHAIADAVSMKQKGIPADEIVSILEKEALLSVVLLGVDNLTYLKRGGRITPAAAAIASVLNIKPLLIIQGERIDSYDKTRGQKNCQRKLLTAMREYAADFKEKGYRIRVGAASSYLQQANAQEWHQKVKETFPDDSVIYDPLTFSISCHTGPNSFGMGISVISDSLHT